MRAHQRTAAASDADLAWSREDLLECALRRLLLDGRVRRPARYADDDEFVAVVSALLDVELRRLRDVKLRFVPGGEAPLRDERQRLASLLQATGMTRGELYALLASVGEELHDGIRFVESSRGTRLRLGGSVLVMVGVPKHVSGVNVYASDHPAPPDSTAPLLRANGQDPKEAFQNENGYETSLYLHEVAEDWSAVHRADGLPEGTYYDAGHRDYRSLSREAVEHALFDKARAEGVRGDDGRYVFATDEIARAQVDSFLASVRRYRDPWLPTLPLESGMILRGHPPARYRFLGADLGFIQHAARAGARPRLALPRHARDERARRPRPVLASLSFPDADCTFGVASRPKPLTADEINYAMWEVLERPIRRRYRDVFTDIDQRLVREAGAGPGVAYALAQTTVGKGDGSDRSRITLLIANRFGEYLGWGVRRGGGATEAERVDLVRWAEAHVARMAKDGVVEWRTQYLQYAGLQTLQAERRGNRVLRERLLRMADLLLTRAELSR